MRPRFHVKTVDYCKKNLAKDILKALVILKIFKKNDEKAADKGQLDPIRWRNGRREEEQKLLGKKVLKFYMKISSPIVLTLL